MVGKELKINLGDVLGEEEESESPRQSKRDYKSAKQAAKTLAHGLPNAHLSDLRKKLRDRVAVNFKIPRFVKEEMERILEETDHHNMTFLLYDMLRARGADIPDNSQMDLRKT